MKIATTTRAMPAGQSPREKRHQRTRAAILDAALDVINSEGLDALSIRRIAREIDYSPAALYEYFKGKDDIIDALCHQVDARLADYLNRVSETLPAAQRLVEVGMKYLEFARENRREYSLLFSAPVPDLRPDSLPEAGQSPNYGSGFLILLEVVSDFLSGSGAGEPPPSGPPELINRDAFAYSCWAFVHGMASLSEQVATMTQQELTPVHRAALERFIIGRLEEGNDD